jgi:hypothetical protein
MCCSVASKGPVCGVASRKIVDQARRSATAKAPAAGLEPSYRAGEIKPIAGSYAGAVTDIMEALADSMSVPGVISGRPCG